MNKQETIADIIAEKRLRAAEMEKTLGDQHSFVESLKDDADRLEAAWKREKSVIEADALSAGGLVQAMRQKMATAENSSAVGDAAKLREALSDVCYAMFNFLKTQNGGCEEMANALDKAKAALAAPPRTCDMPLVVDGPADNNADKAWLAFKHHNPDVYFDVPGLLRCIDWLLAPAAEKKGGAK